MTIQDLHIAIKMELDKNVISGYPSFTEEQIDYFINRAYLMLINQKFTGHNELQAGFEGNTKRIADLNDLIVRLDLAGNIVDGNEYHFSTTSANDILYVVSQLVEFGDAIRKTVIDIDHSIINKFILSDVNNPWIPEPAITWERDKARVFVDPIDMDDYPSTATLRIEYIKLPVRLQFYLYDGSGNRTPNMSGTATQIPEIAEHVHQEIVSVAIDLMLDNIESQRIQTHPQITQMKE